MNRLTPGDNGGCQQQEQGTAHGSLPHRLHRDAGGLPRPLPPQGPARPGISTTHEA